MATRIVINIQGLRLTAELHDTETARAIAAVLPVVASPKEWGEEFYFEVAVDLPLDATATTAVKAGDIGYWPPGRALAIFFGPTPLSTGADPVPASSVNIVGKILGDPALLKQARGAREVRVEKG